MMIGFDDAIVILRARIKGLRAGMCPRRTTGNQCAEVPRERDATPRTSPFDDSDGSREGGEDKYLHDLREG